MTGQLQLTFVNFKQSAYIVLEGKQNAGRFFIIHRGKVRISKEVPVVEEEGNCLGPGDFFAVISTMSSHSHIETAQALTDVTLISVRKDQYGQLIQNNAPIAMKIILQFSRRLRYLDEAFSRLTLKSTADEDPSHLFNVAEYYAGQSQYSQAYYAYHQYLTYCPYGKNVNAAKQKMAKIAPYAKVTVQDHQPDEFNRIYPKDSMFFSEGEPGGELYIIQRGSVKIAKIVNNSEVLLAVLKDGDIFGEMALLEAKPRTASAVAREDCIVLAVNRANFERMIRTQPQIIARLTTLLSERIWFIYKQLANAFIIDPLAKIYHALLIQLEKNREAVDAPGPYTFDFGPRELFNMVGIPQEAVPLIFRKLAEDKTIQVVHDKIHVAHVPEITRQFEFHRRIRKTPKSR
ncbi:MAG: Crp/Fnr family transcriptional regulator [Treponema sp.]|jgi:CRP-like cAMP-binding protein|nr:Crp/Fnr family transcriptional regulator [Treponema sp.]